MGLSPRARTSRRTNEILERIAGALDAQNDHLTALGVKLDAILRALESQKPNGPATLEEFEHLITALRIPGDLVHEALGTSAPAWNRMHGHKDYIACYQRVIEYRNRAQAI